MLWVGGVALEFARDGFMIGYLLFRLYIINIYWWFIIIWLSYLGGILWLAFCKAYLM